MNDPVFIAAGEALTDLLRTGADTWRSQVGGSTWNVARAVARLGLPSAFAGTVSTDTFGAELVAASATAGLDLRFLRQVDSSPLLAIVHALDPPRYFFVGDDSADLRFDPATLPAGWQRAARRVHFGGISLAREPLAGTLVALAAELNERGVPISYDPNFRAAMDERYDATFARMARLADVIKVSDEDLRGLFRTTDADAAFGRLRGMNPAALILYTRGAAGASLYHGERHWHAAPPPVAVVDTVGAGDASMGALLYSLAVRPGADGGDHLRFAVAAGAAACACAGSTPPSREQVEALLPHTGK